jgi:mono/diheme cytochrome c family protein
MAVYVAWLMGGGAAPAPGQTEEQPVVTSGDSLVPPLPASAEGGRGALIYATACSSCHDSGRPPPFGGIDLKKSTAVHADSPQNIINMVLFGLPAAEGRTGAIMPGFAGAIGESDMVELLNYLRSTFAGKPAWTNAAQLVSDTLSGKTPVKLYGADGIQRSASLPASPRTTP